MPVAWAGEGVEPVVRAGVGAAEFTASSVLVSGVETELSTPVGVSKLNQNRTPKTIPFAIAVEKHPRGYARVVENKSRIRSPSRAPWLTTITPVITMTPPTNSAGYGSSPSQTKAMTTATGGTR